MDFASKAGATPDLVHVMFLKTFRYNFVMKTMSSNDACTLRMNKDWPVEKSAGSNSPERINATERTVHHCCRHCCAKSMSKATAAKDFEIARVACTVYLSQSKLGEVNLQNGA